MRTDSIIKQKGFNALAEKLDIVDIDRFFMMINREKFDFAKRWKNLFEEKSNEELSNNAMNYFKKYRCHLNFVILNVETAPCS